MFPKPGPRQFVIAGRVKSLKEEIMKNKFSPTQLNLKDLIDI